MGLVLHGSGDSLIVNSGFPQAWLLKYFNSITLLQTICCKFLTFFRITILNIAE